MHLVELVMLYKMLCHLSFSVPEFVTFPIERAPQQTPVSPLRGSPSRGHFGCDIDRRVVP